MLTYLIIVAAITQSFGSITTLFYYFLLSISTVLVLPDDISDTLKMVDLFNIEVLRLIWYYTDLTDPNLYKLECIYKQILWLLDTKWKYSDIISNYLRDLPETHPSHNDLIKAESKLNKLEIFLEKFKKNIQEKIDSKL